MSDAQVPAGWFPDPEDATNLRYWDGAAWTDHRHPVEPAAAAAAPVSADPVVAVAPVAAEPVPEIPVAPAVAAEDPQSTVIPPPLAPAPAAPPAAPAYGAVPAYGAAPAYGTPPPAQNVPALVGLILAIVGTVLGLLLGVFVLVGIAGGVVSIVGMVQANRMRAAGTPGDRRGLALAGIIVGFGGLLLNLIIGGLVAVYYASMYSF